MKMNNATKPASGTIHIQKTAPLAQPIVVAQHVVYGHSDPVT
jgi:hypothetical protein